MVTRVAAAILRSNRKIIFVKNSKTVNFRVELQKRKRKAQKNNSLDRSVKYDFTSI